MLLQEKEIRRMNRPWTLAKAVGPLTLLLAFTLTRGVYAQADAHRDPANVEVAVTYAPQRALSAGGFWFQGGTVELYGRLWRGLGIEAKVAGAHAGGSAQVVPLDTITTTFGPRYTVAVSRRFSFFGEALIGELNAFHTVVPGAGGGASAANAAYTDSGSAFALEAGGAVDWRFGHHFAWRALQADWVRSTLPNGADNVQNSLRLGTGLVFRR
jgi:hypothetical protein